MSARADIPIPLINYLRLIERKESPYYDVIHHIVSDMEENYKKREPDQGIIYTVNPRLLKVRIQEKIPSDKLTPINISRSLLALLYGSRLRRDEDYYVTTSSSGRKNYHIKVNSNVLSTLRMRL